MNYICPTCRVSLTTGLYFLFCRLCGYTVAVRFQDCAEDERRASLRRRRSRVRPAERKRHAWEARIWRQYGLTSEDVARRWDYQGGLCPICWKQLTAKVWVIEHQHVKGFAKLPPGEKAKHFRGLVCGWDNHRVLSMCERAGYMRVANVVRYLWQPPISPSVR
jgi:hypothetical protein